MNNCSSIGYAHSVLIFIIIITFLWNKYPSFTYFNDSSLLVICLLLVKSSFEVKLYLVKIVEMSMNGKETSFTSSDASNEVRVNIIFTHPIVLGTAFKINFISRKSLLQKCPIRATDLGLCLHVQQIHVVLVNIFYGL